ncbi:MAG: hypothetical protein R3C68_19130, partial [Myxococcota bacterium]
MKSPATMRPPLLQTPWVNRVVFNPEDHTSHAERFFIRAHAPRLGQVLWLDLGVSSHDGTQQAQCSAIYIDKPQNMRYAACNLWPTERLRIDPERAGMGLAECIFEQGRTAGVVRSE